MPWRLEVGDHTWIGEGVWIDNLAEVRIGAHCCLSQGVYLCTGSHDWSKSTFDLITMPISIHDGAWICAQATIGPGVTVFEGAILGLGSVATSNLDAWGVYQGVPAMLRKWRVCVPGERSAAKDLRTLEAQPTANSTKQSSQK